MAYYAYKNVRDLIPDDFREAFEKRWKEETDRDFEGAADYDGDLWHMAADYIRSLQQRAAIDKPVLDACSALTEFTLRNWIKKHYRSVMALARAELARREGTGA